MVVEQKSLRNPVWSTNLQ